MLLLISPAKTLDFNPVKTKNLTEPRLLKESGELVKILKKYKSEEIQKLMSVSEKIADLNVARYKSFKTPFTDENAKAAVLAFKGDVYTGLEADDFGARDLAFAQKHLRILSGLYGMLRPLDLMQPYRLEMGTKLANKKGKNLYEFWGDKITEQINTDLEASKSKVIVNLASNEYFKSVNTKKLNGELWKVDFKEDRNGVFKVIAFSAKKARGMMCQYVIKNRIKKPEDMMGFNMDNYFYNESLSGERHLVFTR